MTDVVDPHEEVVAPEMASPAVEPIDPDDFGRSGAVGERALEGAPYVRPWRLAGLVAFFALIFALGGVPVVVVVAAVLVMIFLHEAGHFVMARRAGMKVTEFMIGFGPRIWSFRRGEVEYGLKAIPAGAYVKIIGMANVEEVPPADEPRTYRQKSYAARMGVAVAGSAMHFILALVLIGVSFVTVGRVTPERWVVDNISTDSAADVAGVRVGDRVAAVDGVRVATHAEMAVQTRRHPGESIPIEVERDGRTVELTATITPRFTVFGTRGLDFQVFGNVEGGASVSLPADSALERDGLRDGDVIHGVGDRATTTVDEVRAALSEPHIRDSGDVTLAVSRPGSSDVRRVDLDLGRELATDRPAGFFGVGQDYVPERLGVLEAVPASFDWFGDTTVMSVQGLVRFFGWSNLSGFVERVFSTAPGDDGDGRRAQTRADAASARMDRDSNRMLSIVGAVNIGADLTDEGWANLLMFLALLNMAIGIFNLIPLPPFDGGHVAIGTYERIRELARRDGKRYFADWDKVQPLAVAVVSFMLIVGLMAVYLDLADPIKV